jgi:hypothetical protein
MEPLDITLVADELALRRLIARYAQCCDRRDGLGFAALFTDDAVLEGPGFCFRTRAEISGVPSLLDRFTKTYHTLLNHVIELHGEHAFGEAYSMAHHLTPGSDGLCNDLVMYITYRDRYQRIATDWRFERRQVVIEFTENRSVGNVDATALTIETEDS